MRIPGSTCVTKAPPNDKGTLHSGRTLSPTERYKPQSLPPTIQLLNQFNHRIAAADTLEELAQVAADLAAARKALEQAGVIRKPVAGDKEVRDAVRESITDQVGTLEKIIINGIWEGVTKEDVPEGIIAAFKSAFWEATKATLEDKWGAFAKDAAAAVKSHRPKDILKAGADAAAALAKSFSDKDGLMRQALKTMRKNGIFVDKQMEFKLRKLLEKKLGSLAGNISAIGKIFASPVYVFFKVLLTSSRVATDAEENYISFEILNDRLALRYQQLLPDLPFDPMQIQPPAMPGPEIRLR
jgi:DNA polymerase I-like protein with 3'-5' exonuclease and polymerase domains